MEHTFNETSFEQVPVITYIILYQVNSCFLLFCLSLEVNKTKYKQSMLLQMLSAFNTKDLWQLLSAGTHLVTENFTNIRNNNVVEHVCCYKPVLELEPL